MCKQRHKITHKIFICITLYMYMNDELFTFRYIPPCLSIFDPLFNFFHKTIRVSANISDIL